MENIAETAFYRRFKQNMEQFSPVGEKDLITAGISGGPDSVCLLFLLLTLQKEKSYGIQVVHVNHMLRPDASGDASYVDKLCKLFQLTCITVEKPVDKLADKWKISTEEAGRRVRYEALREAAGKALSAPECPYSRSLIALGHHLDDQAETVLFRLFRGSGIAGLCGMRPLHGDLLRPLLSFSKSEILGFLAEHNIGYRIDETNAQDHYTRNRIRGSILPLAKELVNEQAPSHIAAAADKLSVIREYLDEEAGKAFGKCVSYAENGDLLMGIAPFLALHPALRPQLLIRCLDRLGSMKDMGEEHIEALLTLFSRQSGKRLSIPGGVTALRESGHIRLRQRAPKGSEDPETSVSFRVLPNPFSSPSEVPKSDCKKYLDYDTMKNTPVLRHRLPGDYLYVDGASGALHKKNLNRLLIDKKIPVSERDALLLLADGSHVLWVLGYRISAAAKVSEETERILEVTWTRSKS